MECIHCRASNEEDDQRCVRCKRRLRPAGARPAPETREAYPQTYPQSFLARGSAAPAFEALPGGRTEPLPDPPPPRHYQPSLFRPVNRDGAGRGRNLRDDGAAPGVSESSNIRQAPKNPKVIPIPMLMPARPAQRKGTCGPAGLRQGRRGDESQQSLNFQESDGPSAFDSKVEAVIYCDAPVATAEHRLTAAAADAAWMALSFGLSSVAFFGGLAYWDIPAPVLHKQNLMILGAAAGLIALFYKLLWANVNGDSAGMRFARLRLVNFDGRVPSRKQRLIRQAASVLSVLALGCGLLWALVDEENLTWHDHISKTFPTPG